MSINFERCVNAALAGFSAVPDLAAFLFLLVLNFYIHTRNYILYCLLYLGTNVSKLPKVNIILLELLVCFGDFRLKIVAKLVTQAGNGLIYNIFRSDLSQNEISQNCLQPILRST